LVGPDWSQRPHEQGVAAHARPDMLLATAALPTTPTGKIDKKAITRQIRSAAGPQQQGA